MATFIQGTPANSEVAEPIPAPSLSLLDRIGTVFERFASSTSAVIALFSVLYFLPTMWLAAHKLFWDDEFFSLYISQAGSWHEILRALSTGADQHPPTFYYVTHLFTKALGTTHITVRMPQIISYWATCLSLYFLLRGWLGRVWGMVGMYLPVAFWGMYYYATEARGYALVLAFASLALLSWVRVTEGSRRRLFLIVLGASLACAVASHYYALLVTVALGLAELVRTFARRKLDWPVWVAFAATAIPPILFLPVIRSSQSYSGHFWAKPQWHAIYDFNPDMVVFLPNLVFGVAAVTLLFLAGSRRPQESREEVQRLPIWCSAAVVSFLLLPLYAMLLAKTVTHGYTDRYAISGTLAACILSAYALHRISYGSRGVAFFAFLLTLLTFGIDLFTLNYKNWTTMLDLKENRFFLEHESGTGPLVLSEGTVFHRLSFYAQPVITRRMTYVADVSAAVKYMGNDTVEHGLLDLRPWFPLNVVPASEYIREHPSFVAYGYIGDWTWISFDLAKAGVTTKLIGRKRERLLFRVDDATAVLKDLDPSKPHDQTPSLYAKYANRTQSLCAIFMGQEHCPEI